METDVEALANREKRAGLPFLWLVRLYLDPLVLFKSLTTGTAQARVEAWEYNRRHRAMLLRYIRRWTIIALACLLSATPFASLAATDPLLSLPFIGAELGGSIALCAVVISVALYIVLGLEPD